MNSIFNKISHYQALKLKETAISSAVLIPIITENNVPKEILLLKRPNVFSSYAGDICFPGGLKELNDKNLETTAIRETREEINLSIQPKQIIGNCDDFYDGKDRLVRPFIAIIDRENMNSLQFSDEVEKIYFFPLKNLQQLQIDTQNIKRSHRKPPYIYTDNDYLIWGLTASILANLSNIIYETKHIISHMCK